jgi:hypothetical protein
MSQWIVQSVFAGPLVINDLGLMFTYGQTRDLDMLGRDIAERSASLKQALDDGKLRTIKKTAAANTVSEETIAQLTEASNQSMQAAGKMEQVASAHEEYIKALKEQIALLTEQNKALQEQAKAQSVQMTQVQETTNKVLEKVMAYAESHPLEIRQLKQTFENIQVERGRIAQQISELPTSGMSEEEIKTQERMLKARDQKLQRNAENIGKTVSQNDASDVNAALDALKDLPDDE